MKRKVILPLLLSSFTLVSIQAKESIRLSLSFKHSKTAWGVYNLQSKKITINKKSHTLPKSFQNQVIVKKDSLFFIYPKKDDQGNTQIFVDKIPHKKINKTFKLSPDQSNDFIKHLEYTASKTLKNGKKISISSIRCTRNNFPKIHCNLIGKAL